MSPCICLLWLIGDQLSSMSLLSSQPGCRGLWAGSLSLLCFSHSVHQGVFYKADIWWWLIYYWRWLTYSILKLTEKPLMSFLCLYSDQRMSYSTTQRSSLRPDFDTFLFSSEDPLDMTKWGIIGYNSMCRKMFRTLECHLRLVERESRVATWVARGMFLVLLYDTNSSGARPPSAL